VGAAGRARSALPAVLALLALLALLASVLVPLVAAGLRSVLWALLGVAGLALAAAGAWWALAHTGVRRVLGSALAVAAPVVVLALYAAYGMLLPALLSLGLWAVAATTARTALGARETSAASRQPGHAVAEPPRAPWVLMNPRSGGGKVGRFHLVEKAEAAGCRVVLLDGGQDVAELARQAVAEGADLLAVAGGDGTQALVAEVAARHDVPFLVIPAGTRNHFALGLGLDRDDPAAALDALAHGSEIRVDLGYAADRVFVNNASFGVYAFVVTDPAYRDAKAGTALRALPALLTGEDAPRLRMRAGGGRRRTPGPAGQQQPLRASRRRGPAGAQGTAGLGAARRGVRPGRRRRPGGGPGAGAARGGSRAAHRAGGRRHVRHGHPAGRRRRGARRPAVARRVPDRARRAQGPGAAQTPGAAAARGGDRLAPGGPAGAGQRAGAGRRRRGRGKVVLK
jgi:hypothetical protein